MNGIAACSLGCGRSVFFRGVGKALAIASRTIRRCTFTFLATPAIVPTPNSYSRRISSNSSTLALQSNGLPLPGIGPNQGIRSLSKVGQIKPPKWASSDYRNQAPGGIALLHLDDGINEFSTGSSGPGPPPLLGREEAAILSVPQGLVEAQ